MTSRDAVVAAQAMTRVGLGDASARGRRAYIRRVGRRGYSNSFSLSHTPLDLFLNTLAPLLTTITMSDANRQSLTDKMGAALKVCSTRLRGVGGRVLTPRESLTARL